MTVRDLLEEARADAIAEGLAEGRAEGIAEGREEGLAEGRAEGVARMAALAAKLAEDGRAEDVLSVMADPVAVENLLREYRL
jgi:flagellar biosynthesis/type III secretory pathway protein FliH